MSIEHDIEQDIECVMEIQNILQNEEGIEKHEKEKRIAAYMSSIDINMDTGSGFSPLYRATVIGNLEVVRVMLAYGADPNVVSQYGQTPIFYAAKDDRVDIATELMDKGADPNLQDPAGLTPLMYAAGNGKVSMAKYLIAHNVEINVQDKAGNTPLLYAFKSFNKEIVKNLLDNGADMSIQNKKGISGNSFKQAIVEGLSKGMGKGKQTVGDGDAKPIQASASSEVLKQSDKKESTKFRDMVRKSRDNQSARGR